MLDFLIIDATVFDGIQVEPQRVAVGVKEGKVAYVGEGVSAWSAREVIDARGLYLCPGFIDTHASTGLGYMLPNAGDNKIFQGITTEIIGNCGTSTAPIGDRLVSTLEKLAQQMGFHFTWREMDDWFAQVEAYGLPFNIGTFVGHSTLRGGVCTDMQQVSATEIEHMGAMLDRALGAGALGLSTGLVYAPGSFATTQEIIDLARVVAKHQGIYVSHIRDERQNLEDAIDEAIEIGQTANVPVLVSHLKAAEKPNWGKMPRIIERIEAARRTGVRISFEVYPYTAASTKLRTFIPKDIMQGSVAQMSERLRADDWRNRCVDWLNYRGTDYATMILITESMPGVRGKSVQDIAERYNTPPGDMIVDLLISDPDAWIVYHCMDESDMDAAILWPESIICSDSWSYPVNAPHQIGNPHPRTYGAFTRFLERYALREERLPFGHAVRKISSYAATWLHLPFRGCIAEGYFADLTLLDPDAVEERATFAEPRQFSEGTEYVWVNGVKVLDRGVLQQSLPGQVIRNHSLVH